MLGLGLGLNKIRKRGGADPFEPEYQAVLDYNTTQGNMLPSDTQQAKENQLVKDLKDADIWNRLDVFGIVPTDGDAAYALTCFKRLITMDAVNSPTHVPLQGFTGDAASAHIRTGFVPSTDGVNYSLDSASYGFYAFTQQTSDGFEIGCFDRTQAQNTGANMAAYRNSSINVVGPNDNSQQTIAIGDGTGLHHADRDASNSRNTIKNGNIEASYSNSSILLPTIQFYTLGRNLDGSLVQPVDNNVGLIFGGASLLDKRTEFNTIIQDYLNSL